MREAISVRLDDAKAFQETLEQILSTESGSRFQITHSSCSAAHEMDKASIVSLIEEIDDVIESPFEFDTIRIKFWALKGKRRVPHYMMIRR